MSERPNLSRPQKTADRTAHASRSSAPTPPAPAEEPAPVPSSNPSSEHKSANEAIEEFRRANDASAREKVTVTLDPAVLGTLRDLKKLHKLPQGVAIDLAVKNFYPDLYEKNVQELKDFR